MCFRAREIKNVNKSTFPIELLSLKYLNILTYLYDFAYRQIDSYFSYIFGKFILTQDHIKHMKLYNVKPLCTCKGN